jgi:hypothetical protein
MHYFKVGQPVPGKGDAWTYYECDDEKTIVRQLTHITATNEITCIPDPIVKSLYRPEMLFDTTAEEFTKLWDAAH